MSRTFHVDVRSPHGPGFGSAAAQMATELVLIGTQLTRETCLQLGEYVRRARYLTHLRLGFIKYDGMGMASLASALHGNHALVTLAVSGGELSRHNVDWLVAALGECRALHTLELCHAHIADTDTVGALARAVRAHPSLARFCAFEPFAGDAPLDAFGAFFEGARALRSFALQCSGCQPTRFVALARATLACPTLVEYDVPCMRQRAADAPRAFDATARALYAHPSLRVARFVGTLEAFGGELNRQLIEGLRARRAAEAAAAHAAQYGRPAAPSPPAPAGPADRAPRSAADDDLPPYESSDDEVGVADAARGRRWAVDDDDDDDGDVFMF